MQRVLPVLAAAGMGTMRLPAPGRGRRRTLDAPLPDTPAPAVLIGTCERRARRPEGRAEADACYSGKRQQHPLKSRVAVGEDTGAIGAVAPGGRGPPAGITVLGGSGLPGRRPHGVGGLGDLAYVGLARLHPAGLGATPRRKPRGRPRPAADLAYKQACARRRAQAAHGIGRRRRSEAVSQPDRRRRRGHTPRARAVAGAGEHLAATFRRRRGHTPRARAVAGLVTHRLAGRPAA